MVRLTHDLWTRYKTAFLARDLVVEPTAWIMAKPGRNCRYNQGNTKFRHSAYVMYMIVHKHGSEFYFNPNAVGEFANESDYPPNANIVTNVPITPNHEKLKRVGTKSAWRKQENSHTELCVAIGTYCPPEGIVMDCTCGTAVSALAALRLGIRLVIMNDRDGNTS